MNRREAGKTLLAGLLALGGAGRGQTPVPAPVRIAEPSRLLEVWADLEFRFAGQPCLLVRVPPPARPSPRVLEVQGVFLIAFSRVCPHAGCTVPLPDQQRFIECGCHGSRFQADGLRVAGPAPTDLPGIRLELREGAVWAVGWLDG
ncbi:MAG: ubiquinol-cytochrome c reductase iron-sulfur subunit [Meiothermus ruber]|uniref:QcrA and Rieske domain-containing protein n=1 Tax=Meiothermus ruber TaxID=277 RepID=UPI00391D66FA